MKNRGLWLIIIGAVLISIGVIWFLPKGSPSPTTSTAPAGTPSGEARAVLPKVLTLYQPGDGESDLAVFVAKELSGKFKGMAAFHVVNILDEPQIAEFFGVNSTPTIVFQLPSGRVFSKHEGYLDKNRIIATIKAMTKG